MLQEIDYVDEVKTATFPENLKEELLSRKRNISGAAGLDKRGIQYIMPFLLTKFREWAPEQEVRAFIRRRDAQTGNHFAELTSDGIYLEEVVLGSACVTSEHEILELVKGYPRKVNVRRATLISGFR